MRKLWLLVLILAASCGAPVRDIGSAPERFIAQASDGRIVVAHTADGSIERVLLERATDETRFEVPDDRSGVYYQRTPGCEPVRFRSLDGGDEEEVLRGMRRWSVSPDGRSIAYVSDADCQKQNPAGYEVTIRDLGTGPERSWSIPCG